MGWNPAIWLSTLRVRSSRCFFSLSNNARKIRRSFCSGQSTARPTMAKALKLRSVLMKRTDIQFVHAVT
ncbi:MULTISPECIES: hypothetical protein [unclassified Providencia]|uniref:hypothetical protein n=1 Tax=unclassified Providencia TaxID=2633465 RepID=UPI00234AE6AA|nr:MULTISPECIES: hypothetical protein [unclassified Providencia]